MKVSFYINRKDLQELNYLVTNSDAKGPFEVSKFSENAIAIECFNSVDRVVTQLEIVPNPIPNSYIEVSIDYTVYNRVQEYLKFR